MATVLEWSLKSFQELELEELYAFGQLRQEVFIIEQNCPYLDFDGKDAACQHLMGHYKGALVAYTRLVPLGVSYANAASIGRVVSSPALRGQGLGKALMIESLAAVQQLWGTVPITISAQDYLLRFYEGFDFVDSGKKYLEDDIPHTEMHWKGIHQEQ
ncbi:MAG: GNAT family N-acetyltransferase [Aureispira sp.]